MVGDGFIWYWHEDLSFFTTDGSTPAHIGGHRFSLYLCLGENEGSDTRVLPAQFLQ